VTDDDLLGGETFDLGERRPAMRVRRYRLRPATGGAWELGGPLVRVGSREGNDVVLDDRAVSRVHFEIAVDAKGFRLRDLGSTNGTYVDRYRVTELWLEPGAPIRAGATELVFEPLDDSVEVPLSTEDRFGPLVGRSEPMRRLFAELDKVARSGGTVLVEGESGTGKELAARAIHAASERPGGPFVVFDCAAVPPRLVESELFGHERGAFTGAEARRIGSFEQAHGGTLFLDEIGELPLDLQPKLLRALERREIRRLGGREMVPVDVRIVAATNRDLAREVNRGAFRDDLYYRLAVFRVVLPSLRERGVDVPMLVEHFVRGAFSDDPATADALLSSVGSDQWDRLADHAWPGNVRELRNTVERGLAMAGDPPRSLHLEPPRAVLRRAVDLDYPAMDMDRPFREQRDALLAQFEEGYVTRMLARHGGKITRAADAAGLDRTQLKRIMRRRGLLASGGDEEE